MFHVERGWGNGAVAIRRDVSADGSQFLSIVEVLLDGAFDDVHAIGVAPVA